MQAGIALAGEVHVGRDEEKAATGPKGAPTYAVDLDGDGTADVVSYEITSVDTETPLMANTPPHVDVPVRPRGRFTPRPSPA
jgi:hypothetical protein